MIISIIASFWLAQHLHRVAKATDSAAIEASARMIKADFYSAGRCAYWSCCCLFYQIANPWPHYRSNHWLFLYWKRATSIVLRAFRELQWLLALPKEEQEILNNCIREHFHAISRFPCRCAAGVPALNGRGPASGNAAVWSVSKMLTKCATIWNRILKPNYPTQNVVIHVEPCVDNDCVRCSITICRQRKPQPRISETAPTSPIYKKE